MTSVIAMIVSLSLHNYLIETETCTNEQRLHELIIGSIDLD